MSTWQRMAFVLGALAALLQAQAPRPADKPPSCEIAKDGTVTVRGRVVFTDRAFRRQEAVTGSVQILLWYANEKIQIGDPSADIDFVKGAWTASFRRPEHATERPERLYFSDATVAGEPVILESDTLLLDGKAELVLRLRAIPELRVRAFDAATKQELANVEIWRSGGWDEAGGLHPGAEGELERLVDAGKSPVLVPPPEEVRPESATLLWIRAPGYAWRGLEVMFAEGGVREAPLVRGGSAKIAISGKLPAAGKVALRIHAADAGVRERPLLDLALADGPPGLLEHLAPGRYEARLELGDWYRDPQVLARAPLEIQAGSTASVELVAKEIASPERATLRGVFVVPAGWERAGEGPSVSLEPLLGTDRWTERRRLHARDLQPGERAGEHRFVFPDTVAGRYALVFEPSHYQKVVHVTKRGLSDLRIELPEPVEILVRVLDRDSKQPRKGVTLSWHPEWPPGVFGGSLESASAAPDSNQVRLLVPAGKVVVMAHEQEFEVPTTRLDVAPDEREFEVFAQVRQAVKVAFYEGTTRIPAGIGSGWDVSLLTVDGAPVRTSHSSTESELTVLAPAAGIYVLRVTAPEEYRPVADRQVKLGPPPFPTIDISVARK